MACSGEASGVSVMGGDLSRRRRRGVATSQEVRSQRMGSGGEATVEVSVRGASALVARTKQRKDRVAPLATNRHVTRRTTPLWMNRASRRCHARQVGGRQSPPFWGPPFWGPPFWGPTCWMTEVTMTGNANDAEPLLTPAEVAARFKVDPKTVTRWAKAGKLTSIRTLGGHRRYHSAEVQALLEGQIPTQRAGEAS